MRTLKVFGILLWATALLLPLQGNAAPPPTEYIILYRDGTLALLTDRLDRTPHAVSPHSAQVLLKAKSYLVPQGDFASRLEAARADPDVRYLEPNSPVELLEVPNDEYYPMFQSKIMESLDLPGAWHHTTGNADVIVAVMDTGMQGSHPDLGPNLWVNPGEIPANGVDDDRNGYVDDVNGYNTFDDNGNASDDLFGHGTSVAGIIGAVGNNGFGVAGVNWTVRMISVRMWGSDPRTPSDLYNIMKAYQYVLALKRHGVNIRVVNASFGTSESSPGGIEEYFVRELEAEKVLLVAASGNDGRDTDATPVYPACFSADNVVSVGGVDPQTWTRCSFSNYGSRTVDLFAPGNGVLTTGREFNFRVFLGTSSAAPFVTGLGALLWAASPDASMAQVRDALLEGVTLSDAFAGKCVSGGILNARGSMEQLLSPPAPQRSSSGGGCQGFEASGALLLGALPLLWRRKR